MSTQFSQTVFSPWLTPVRLVSTTNIVGTYSNGPTNNGLGATLTTASPLVVDSVTCNLGDRVLLVGQTAGYQNGVYVVETVGSSVVLQRAADQQNLEQIQVGQYLSVAAGTVNAGTFYTMVEPKPLQLGVSAVVWNQVTAVGGGTVSPGTAGQVAQYPANGSLVSGANLSVNSPLTLSSAPGSITIGSTVAGNLYVNGFQLVWNLAGSFDLLMQAGQARNSTNATDIVMNNSVILNPTSVGVNGLDVGSPVVSTVYAVYVIADSNNVNPTAGLLSLNTTTPALPAGYNIYRRVGWTTTNPLNNAWELMYQVGLGNLRGYYYLLGYAFASGFSNTSWVLASMNIVPAIDNGLVYLGVQINAAVTGDTVYTVPAVPEIFSIPANASTIYGPATVGVYGFTKGQCGYNLVAGLPSLYYSISNGAATGTLAVGGFSDSL